MASSSVADALSASDVTMVDVSTTSSEYQEVDSLPSSPTTSSSSLTLSDLRSETDAEREWKESLQQLELLLSLVIVPYLGKYFGRKFAYWGWKRLMEWKYPVEVVVASPATFKGVGMLEAAASL
ncbi:hypothetical protein DV737_g4226, partial [Chaetothyriales sp. CBS 132003]